ncbi:MAG TPA: hypothetical protein VG992_00355 [Candidatus Saccharimonadales bacterium]|nr:hypothetical protein [Candidatus Saccharimonadales bacterium]
MTTGKSPKVPPLGPHTKLLSFDLESNGLHGEAFAVGAVVMDARGKVLDEFTARCDIVGEIDPWVRANVLPAIAEMPVTHKTYHDLQEAFWAWYVQAEPQADYVLVSNGYPVEYRFLLKCQDEDLDERYWQHPFPILDLTSLLMAAGQNPGTKNALLTSIIAEHKFARHHPLHDAKAATLAAFKILGLSD